MDVSSLIICIDCTESIKIAPNKGESTRVICKIIKRYLIRENKVNINSVNILWDIEIYVNEYVQT